MQAIKYLKRSNKTALTESNKAVSIRHFRYKLNSGNTGNFHFQSTESGFTEIVKKYSVFNHVANPILFFVMSRILYGRMITFIAADKTYHVQYILSMRQKESSAEVLIFTGNQRTNFKIIVVSGSSLRFSLPG